MTGMSFHRIIIIDGRVIKNNTIQVLSKQDMNFSILKIKWVVNGQKVCGGGGLMDANP